MNILLPYRNFACSAFVLADRDLERQVSDAQNALGSLRDKHYRTPLLRAWRGYEAALALYASAIVRERLRRGASETRLAPFDEHGLKNKSHHARDLLPATIAGVAVPPWLTVEFCADHRRWMLANDSEWYGRWGWDEEPDRMVQLWNREEAAA